jgi:hypothetical protein
MILPGAQKLLQLASDRGPVGQRWFFLFYLLFGIPYLLLTGPFRVPDERNHFLRSYEISEFRLFPFRISGGYPGDNLPSSLSRLSDALGYHADHHILPRKSTRLAVFSSRLTSASSGSFPLPRFTLRSPTCLRRLRSRPAERWARGR